MLATAQMSWVGCCHFDHEMSRIGPGQTMKVRQEPIDLGSGHLRVTRSLSAKWNFTLWELRKQK